MASFEISPQGPFDLATAQDFAGGFAPGLGGDTTVSDNGILMTFPLEDGSGSAAGRGNAWTDRPSGSPIASPACSASHALMRAP